MSDMEEMIALERLSRVRPRGGAMDFDSKEWEQMWGGGDEDEHDDYDPSQEYEAEDVPTVMHNGEAPDVS